MIMQGAILLADWLADDETGVNAYLAELPRLPGDDEPAAITAVEDVFRSERVANHQEPANLPAIYVINDGPAILEGEAMTVYRDADVPIDYTIRLFIAEPDTPLAARLVEYYLRAIVRSVAAFLDNENAGERTLLDIEVVGATRIVWTPWHELVGNARVAGLVGLSLQMRDNAP